MATDSLPFIPYCGVPPVPGDLSTAWNTDPVLLAAFALSVVGLAMVVRRADASGVGVGARPWCLAAGWLALGVAFVSPLCSLTSALFSARVAQHLLTIQVAAPLFVLGWPARGPRWPQPLRRAARPLRKPELAWGLFGITLWVWHLPGPYMVALANDAVLWLMHATLFAGAVAAWRTVLAPADDAMRLRGLLAAFGTSVHLAMLAALLIFAGTPLFPYHLTTTTPWGLSPLADQQLGGLIMGVVGSLAYVALVLAGMAGWLRRGVGLGEDRPLSSRRAG
ncbi:cytochrome c oxidase assembly protein [Azospirillum sp. YIM B02556]|uniref:Cytochrome c oxidase assembly protein n=1 Tax=Azospirillum endophyticum TaxID=2800326 RepID=A0ABS1F9A1_9PROT|nr:cytochrome c oxidase assembly protein [Azospirillum endophyticum]MBK1840000.1 cytochrome c oxidase assembly protein [Azospirillum endophyticum]